MDSAPPDPSDVGVSPTVPRGWAWALTAMAVVAAIEIARLAGTPIGIPYLLIYASVVLAASLGGRGGGMLGAGVASAYILWSYSIGVGPATLTGHLGFVVLGAVLHLATAWIVGSATDRVARLLSQLRGRRRELEETVTERTAELVSTNETLKAEVARRERAESERLVREVETRALQSRLEQAQRLESLGVLAGGIAHDFNNLLTSVLGSTQLLTETLTDNTPERALAGEIERASQRAADLVAQMLAYAGQGPRAQVPLDLRPVLADVAALVRSSVTSHARLEVSHDDVVCGAIGDPTQLAQLAMNLVTNAAQAVQAGGSVRLSCGVEEVGEADLRLAMLADDLHAGRYTIIAVKDDGPGMSKEQIERAFEPFYTNRPDGRGLGLSVVFGVVRSHGGAVRVCSKTGQGTEFRVYLPWADVPEQVPSPQPPAEAVTARPPKQCTVLVIDDEPAILTLVQHVLRRAGHAVTVAPDGVAGLAIARGAEQPFCVALVDLTMPGPSGLEVLRTLTSEGLAQHPILMTGFAHSPDFDGVAVIHKPFLPAALLAALTKITATAAE